MWYSGAAELRGILKFDRSTAYLYVGDGCLLTLFFCQRHLTAGTSEVVVEVSEISLEVVRRMTVIKIDRANRDIALLNR